MGFLKRWCLGVAVVLTTCVAEVTTTGGAFVAGAVGGELVRSAVATTPAGEVLACR